jgi:hypothetical protein
MSTLWTPEVLTDIAQRISTQESIRFWDEDEVGCLQELEKENITRYLNNFLPAIGIFNLPDQDSKGIPKLSLVFFYEGRVERINAQQFETVIRKILSEAGYSAVNELMHFKKNQFFGKGVLNSIPCLEGRTLLRDNGDCSIRFFANGYVKITSDKVTEALPYSSLSDNCYIWNDLVTPRHYRPSEFEVRSGDRHFRDYVANLSRDPEGEFNDQAFERLQIAIGYLCHRHNRASERRCVILIDRLDDESLIGQSNGGTGKSILVKGLYKVLNAFEIDGKAFKQNSVDKFAFGGMTEAHELVNIEDTAENFDFDRIYTQITSNFQVRSMRQNPISIPAGRAPKIVISTNRPIGDSDFSTRRRQFVVEVSPYYREQAQKYGKTPKDLHGGMQLCEDDWGDHDWNEFYQFIFECIQVYLRKGLPKHNEESKNYKRSQFISRCGSPDTLDAIERILEQVSASGDEWFVDQFYAEIRRTVPSCKVTEAILLGVLKDVAEAQGYLFNPQKNGNKDSQRLNGDRWSRWVALGLDQSTKKTGGSYQKDDRVTVFRVSKDGIEAEKNALELMLYQS